MTKAADPSTPARPRDDDDDNEEWLLLCDVLGLTASYTKSVTAAERLLLETAQSGGFPSCGGNGPFIGPRNWGTVTGPVSYPVNWEASFVAYVRREVSPYSTEGVVLEKLRDFLPVEPLFTMTLVRLPRRDVFAMLKRAGLLPGVKGTAAQTLDAAALSASGTVSPAPAPATEPAAAASAVAPAPAPPPAAGPASASSEIGISDEISDEVPKLNRKSRVKSLERQVVEAILRDQYPQGLPPDDEVRPADLRKLVEREWKNPKFNPKRVPLTSRWTIKRVIDELRALPSPPWR